MSANARNGQTQQNTYLNDNWGNDYSPNYGGGDFSAGGSFATNAAQGKAAGEPISQGPYPEQNPMGGNRLPDVAPQQNDYGVGALGLGLGGGYQGGWSAPQTSYNFQYGPSQYTPNPYLGEQVNNITRGFNRNLQEQVLPGLRSKFIGSGGLGGSRQGIAEGLAAGRSGEGLSQAITNLYASDYENSQNRALQGGIASMNAGLSARNMELQDAMNRLNSERNFYTAQRGQDLSQMGLAAGLLQQANQGFLGQGQGIYGLGLQEQNAPWQQLQNYAGAIGPFQQAGATNTQTQQYSYNPWMQGIGMGIQGVGALGSLGWKPFG